MSESAFGFEQPEHSPGFLLWQTTITWQRLIKQALEPYDIAHAQFVIMACLLWFEEQQIVPTQILMVRQTKLDKMTVSKSLKKMAVQGLIARVEHEYDTRAKSVRLTDKGKILAGTLVPVVENIDKQFFGQLNQLDQQDLINVLAKLIAPC
ncbi:MAG: MarR family winged helix-turn-helix transcriptional regulator [Gammaproteobacteria bacterium]|nr:MarR family winged helix-turn-helix transcriptional regulator [Gammaproteobacteria bacterium]